MSEQAAKQVNSNDPDVAFRAIFVRAGTPYPDEITELIPIEEEGWYVVSHHDWDDPQRIVLLVDGEYTDRCPDKALRVAELLNAGDAALR